MTFVVMTFLLLLALLIYTTKLLWDSRRNKYGKENKTKETE